MKKILIIDESPNAIALLSALLRNSGFKVRSKNNAYNLENTVLDFKPDLILLNTLIGALDGRALCNQLKQTNKTHLIPIIMISDADDLSSQKCNANAFINKPFDIGDTLQIVAHEMDLQDAS